MSRDTEALTERAPSLDEHGRAAYRVVQSDRSVSTAVVEAVGEVTESDPLTGDWLLYDVVDPDALDRLFEGRAESAVPSARVEFELRDCRVVVRGDGDVVVYGPAGGADEPRSSVTGPA